MAQRDRSICDTAQQPLPCRPCTHSNSVHTLLLLLYAGWTSAWTWEKNILMHLVAETPPNSSACGLFRGESLLWCAAGSSEGTTVHLKQALCSWDCCGYHGNKNKNNDDKRPDRQQAFSDFPLSESHSACEAVVPTAVPEEAKASAQQRCSLHQKGYSRPCNWDNVAPEHPGRSTGC